MFDGLFTYGGQEIINAARTRAYLEHLQPTLALGDMCCECDTIAEAQGDAPYSTPSQDNAEWFNPYAPETGGFYGLVPLAAEGFQNSTWTVPLTDLMGDGSISGRGRRAGRDLRFRALAVAESEKAMDRGLAWLRDALGTEGCASGDCGGATLCYLTDCPGCCAEDAPEVVTLLDLLDYRGMSTGQAATAAAADWQSDVTPTGAANGWATYAVWSPGVQRLERTLDGFVPGATYRIAMEFGGASQSAVVTVSVPGARETLEPRKVDDAFTWTAPPVEGTAVWTFIATECTHRFVIESTEGFALSMWTVSLTGAQSLAYSGQPAAFPSHAAAWTMDILPDPAFVVTQPYPGEWHVSSPTVQDLVIGETTVLNMMTGLRPGRRYRVAVLATTDMVTGSTATAMPGTVRVRDKAGTFLAHKRLPTDELGNGFHGGWVEYEFTATDFAASLYVSNVEHETLSPGTTIVIGVHSAIVEEIAPFPEIPDPNDVLRRHMNDVVLTSGPTVSTLYPSYTAVMCEVEWTMRANKPDPLGEDIVVATTLNAGRWTVTDTACSLGEPVRVNYIKNPSGEYGVANWPVPANSTVTNPESATAKSGTHVMRMSPTVADTTNRFSVLLNQPVIAGTGWTFTLPSRTNRLGVRSVAQMVWLNAAGVQTGIQEKSVPLSDYPDDWQDVVITGTAPPGSTTLRIVVSARPPVGQAWVVGDYIEYDAVILEQQYGQRAYFDGDYPFSTWSTPLAKGVGPSTYQRTSPRLVVDPECPPLPLPPRPPDIVNECLTVPAAWTRYVINVPALAAAAAPRAAPVMTLSTGSAYKVAGGVRGARVRYYANPYSGTIEDIDPCSYCGEFLISYMPPDATLTVDAAARTATILTPTGEQTATPLLFGSDGGPMTWPVLGCAIPYIVTVDVDASSQMLVGATLSITPIF